MGAQPRGGLHVDAGGGGWWSSVMEINRLIVGDV